MAKTEYLWEIIPGLVGAWGGGLAGADLGHTSATNYVNAENEIQTQNVYLQGMEHESSGAYTPKILAEQHHIQQLTAEVPVNNGPMYEWIGTGLGFSAVFALACIKTYRQHRRGSRPQVHPAIPTATT